MQPTQILALVSVAFIGPLAGMALDQSIVKVPARHRIGVSAFSAWMRAADLTNGVFLYAAFGIGAAVLAIAAAISGHLSGLYRPLTAPLDISAVLAVLHSITTAVAATTAFSQRNYALNDEAALAKIFDRFARWNAFRAVFQVLNFFVALWAIAFLFRTGA